MQNLQHPIFTDGTVEFNRDQRRFAARYLQDSRNSVGFDRMLKEWYLRHKHMSEGIASALYIAYSPPSMTKQQFVRLLKNG